MILDSLQNQALLQGGREDLVKGMIRGKISHEHLLQRIQTLFFEGKAQE